MDMGLFDKSGKQIEFPLNIEPKNSYIFYLKVGLLIDPRSFGIIKDDFTSKNEITISEVNHLLAKNGMDLYGNPIEYLQDGSVYGITVPSNRSEQIFLINFVTSNHNSFANILSWYKIRTDV